MNSPPHLESNVFRLIVIPMTHIGLLVAYACVMAIGNIVLAEAARGIHGASLGDAIVNVLTSIYFWLGLLIYAVSIVCWLWLLSFIPLRYAYPVAATSIMLAPLFQAALTGDWPALKYWFGVAIVISGLAMIATSR
jgi:drug/metabolite transporter (DMT)-like permease